LIVQSKNGRTGFSGWISKETGGAIGKACRGSEVPLRAFCREVRLRFHASPSKSKIKFIGVPKGSPDFSRGEFNCDALACVVKLVYLSKQYV
jgi:predicted RNase H-like nuclease